MAASVDFYINKENIFILRSLLLIPNKVLFTLTLCLHCQSSSIPGFSQQPTRVKTVIPIWYLEPRCICMRTENFSYLNRWCNFWLSLRFPANVLWIPAQSAEFFQKLDDCSSGSLFQARLVSHQLVHGVAKVGGGVAHGI